MVDIQYVILFKIGLIINEAKARQLKQFLDREQPFWYFIHVYIVDGVGRCWVVLEDVGRF